MDGETDAELLGLCAGGSELAFSTFYDRHSSAVLRYALRSSDNSSDAQELLQETFITAWKKGAGIRMTDDSALPWLLVTCRNHARNLERAKRRRRTVPMENVGETASADSTALRDLLSQLEALSEADRELCELCLIDGYSYQEAAEAIGVSVGAVGKRLQRAKSRLRRALLNG